MLLILAIIVAMVGCLRLLGRRWWCICGRWNPWTSAVTSGCNSQHACDPYSTTHVEHGLLLYAVAAAVGLPPVDRLAAVIAIEAIWECIENTNWAINRYRAATISRGYTGDSVINSVGDTICCLFGGWVAAAAPIWVSIGAVVAIEAGLLWWIRDNLSTNVLMLVWPIEAIRRWQAKGETT